MPRNIYKLMSGERVPGTTTVTGQVDKPQLLDWAWKLGKEGKDWREERDGAGGRGTDVHAMIMAWWKGEPVEMVGEIQTRCFKNFKKWLKNNKISPLLIETPLVSELHGFGGQPDLVAMINDKQVLLDIKTGKAIYEDTWWQLAGYGILCAEHGYNIDEYQILRLGQDGTVEDPIRTELDNEKEIFLSLLNIYKRRRYNGNMER